jgi:hypothetical protein
MERVDGSPVADEAFATGARHNDVGEQMRNVATG